MCPATLKHWFYGTSIHRSGEQSVRAAIIPEPPSTALDRRDDRVHNVEESLCVCPV